MLQWRGIAQSDPGRERSDNQDAYVADDDLGLYVVSDGMGGHAVGDVASSLAVASVRDYVVAHGGEAKDREQVLQLARRAVMQASQAVFDAAIAEPDNAGMGCTLTVLIIRDGYVVIAHVGDSRCYLQRGTDAWQLTTDHTVGAELTRADQSLEDSLDDTTYAGVLTRTVGTQPSVQPDTLDVDLLPGDRLVLCTDGFSDHVASPKWLAVRLQGEADDATVEDMVTHAKSAGAGSNLTVLLIATYDDDEDAPGQRRYLEVSSRLRALSSVFLFNTLSVGPLSRLLRSCEVRALEAGETLVAQGETLEALVVVTEGCLELVRGDEEVGTLAPREYAGISALLCPRKARATLRARVASSALLLHRGSLVSLARVRPFLGINLLERLGKELSMSLDDSVARRDDGDPSTTPLLATEKL